MNALSRDPLVSDHREAMARDLLGGIPKPSPITHHTLLPALETGAPLSLADCAWPEGTHATAHQHADEDEVVVVLSGLLELRMGVHVLRLGPGRTAFVPRGTEHEVRALTVTRHVAILTRRSLEAPAAA
jgi:quercetin dioxygenase-like cupin family protein